MPEQNEPIQSQELIHKTLAEAKSLAHEQVSAAWQLQVEKIQEHLTSGWQDHISHVLDERFKDMEEQLGPSLTAEFTAREVDLRRSLVARQEEVASLQAAQAAMETALSEKEAAWQSSLAEKESGWHASRTALESQWQDSLSAKENEWQTSLTAKEGEWQNSLATHLAEREGQLRAEAEQRIQELAARVSELEQNSGASEQGWSEKLNTALAEKEAQFGERLKAETESTARQAQAQAEEAAHQAIHEASVAARRSATRELSERLNQSVRQLAGAANFDQWREALLEGAATQAERVLVFGITETSAVIEAARGIENAQGVECPLSEAPALSSAIDSKDTVVAVRTTSEFGERIAELAAETKGAKVYLFPIQVKDRVAAVLYAEPGEAQIEVSALELLATAAALSLTARRAAEQKAAAAPAPIAAPAPSAPAATAEGLASLMTSLSREEQDLHLRAQRFARVQVAEMRLYKSTLVKEGRTKQNIYGTLRDEIDLSREAFRVQFMGATKSMVDYFHLELVHTLANDDPALLGQDYPGPLNGQIAAHA